jgi:hypothetical protein
VRTLDTKKPTGPPHSPFTKNERVSKALKKAGHRISLGKVAHYRDLVERYRFDLLPPPEPDPKIVRFKKPNGGGDPA